MTNGIDISFFWTIKNFDMCPLLTKQILDSPTFRVGSNIFSFYLCPRGWMDPYYIRAGFRRHNNDGAEKILVSFKMSVLNDKKLPTYHFQATKCSIENDGDLWGYDKFIEREKLLISARSILLPDNTLTIKCDLLSLTVNGSDIDKRDDEDCELNDNQDADILSSDFDKILNNKIYPDFVLDVDNTIFSLHKAVLQVRCPKLMSLAKNSMKGSNIYLLHGIKASVFRTLLQYLYTGTFRISNIDEDTLTAADEFGISDLRHLLTSQECKTISATTEILICDISFTWKIAEFSKLQLNQELVFPVFCINEDEVCKMKIILTNVKSENGLNGLQLRFRKMRNSKLAFIRCKITIIKQKPTLQKILTKEYEHIFEDEDWITPFGSQIDLGKILFDDTLNILFEISMSGKEVNSRIEKVLVKDNAEKPVSGVIKNLKKLQKDLRRMYGDIQNSTSADITLITGDKQYRAHKFILCARSPVFSMMFSNNTLENKQGLVTISDIDAETILSLLLYIHSGCIKNMSISEAINLYAAADKYEVLCLRDKCATLLKTSLDADHLGSILLLSDEHNDENLKKYVYEYIMANPKKVNESKDGLSVLKSRMDLYIDVLHKIIQHMVFKE